jgi:hypothetical protein
MSIEPVYLVLSGELTIRASPAEVWRHVVNYPSWQNFSVVRHISGERGGEGEVVLLSKEEKGFTFPPYYARTIKLEPRRRAIWKTYPEAKDEDTAFFGIVDFRLDDRQGEETLFSYNTIYEFMVSYSRRSEIEEFRSRQQENFDTLLGAIFPKLKDLAETGLTGHPRERHARKGA